METCPFLSITCKPSSIAFLHLVANWIISHRSNTNNLFPSSDFLVFNTIVTDSLLFVSKSVCNDSIPLPSSSLSRWMPGIYIHISFSCIDVVSSRFCSTQACLCRAARCCTLASGCPERGIAEGPRAAAWWNRSTTRRTWTSLTSWTTHSTPSNSIQTCSIDSCRNTMSRTILKRSAAGGGERGYLLSL